MRRIAMLLTLVAVAGGARAGQPPQLREGPLSPEQLESAEQWLLEHPSFPAWGPEGPPPEQTPPPEPSAGPPQPGGVRQAYEQWLEEAVAPVVGLPEGAVYPFGLEVPEVVALPGWTTDLLFEAGEQIESYYFGDPQGWESAEAFEGGAGGPPGGRPHLLVRPVFFDKRTNLVVVTNRRTYHVRLTVPRESEAAGQEVRFKGTVSWYYPEDWRREGLRRAEQQRSRQLALEAAQAAEPSFTRISVGELRYGYSVVVPRKKKRRLPFRPRAVFDDGQRTFVLLPQKVENGSLPAFLLLDGPDQGRPVEWHREEQYLVLHAVGDRWKVIADGRSVELRRGQGDG